MAYLESAFDQTRSYAIVETDGGNNNLTFAHEVAHLMGLKHDDDSRNLSYSPMHARGSTFCGGGFLGSTIGRCCHPTITGKSYGYDRIHYFSAPGIQVSGVNIGDPTYRNAKKHLENTQCLVANHNPNSPFNLSISGRAYAYENTNYTFHAITSGCNGSISYRWEFSTNGFSYYTVSNGTQSSVTTTLQNNLDLYIRVTATCSDGRTITRIHQVTNLDNDNCDPCYILNTDETTLKINDDSESNNQILEFVNDVHVYPNPSSDKIRIEFIQSSLSDVVIVMSDMNGKQEVVLSRELRPGYYSFVQNVEDMIPSIYTIAIRSGEKIQTKRISVL